MATVTVRPAAVETPTASIVKDANAVVQGTDSLGRVLGVKRLTPLRRLNLFKILGNELSGNDRYLGVVALAACCVSIDGDDVRFPNNVLEAEKLVDRLGDEGAACIAKVMQEHFSDEGAADGVDEAKN